MESVTRRTALGAIGSIAAAGIIASHAAQATPATEWDALMARYDAAEADYRRADGLYTPAATDAEIERLDALCERWVDLEGELMALPAPNAPALRWKLDKLLEPTSATSTASWARWYVKQTTKDVARLLGGEA